MKNLLSAPLDFLNDFHGGKSSKRFWGNRLLTIGVMLKLCNFAACFLTPIVSYFFIYETKTFPDSTYQQCGGIADIFMYTGAALLFGGVFESLRKRK